jgi:putative PEP-CTERM system histidine kinase
LAQELDSERLAEGMQFQAYSRLTAFLMHDLKNLAAQLSLIVKNAVQHKHNPEFVDDAFATIEHSVTRMNRLIAQLAERNRKEKRRRVSVNGVIRDVIRQVSDRSPLPSYDEDLDGIEILADQDKMTAIFTHVLRNAQDACAGEGSITVTSETSPEFVNISISDTGKGMDDTFIREKLFKPFESTKGVDGMGIGAYQAREFVRELNGSFDVVSEPGHGTKVTISLPRTV